MTTPPYEPPQPEVIQGVGPYTIPHPYGEGDIVAVILTGEGGRLTLAPEDFTVDPEASETTGDLMLAAGIASEHDGANLVILRQTEVQQDWLPVTGARERSLSVQLDRLARGLQDGRRDGAAALRADVPIAPVRPMPGRVLSFDGQGQPEAVVSVDDVASANAFGPVAIDAAASAVAAVEQVATASNRFQVFNTYAQMQQAFDAGLLGPGATMEVVEDETLGGARTRYFIFSTVSQVPDSPPVFVNSIRPDAPVVRGVASLTPPPLQAPEFGAVTWSSGNPRPLTAFGGALYGYDSGRLYRQASQGAAWEDIGPTPGGFPLWFLIPTTDGQAVAVTGGAIWKSTGWGTGALAWTEKQANSGSTATFNGFSGGGDGTNFIFSEYATGSPGPGATGWENSRYAWASTDAGETWTAVYDSLDLHGTEDHEDSHIHSSAYDPVQDVWLVCEGHAGAKGIWWNADPFSDPTDWTRIERGPQWEFSGGGAPTCMVATTYGIVMATDHATNGVAVIDRGFAPADMSIRMGWEWHAGALQIAGFGLAYATDPATGIVYFAWRRESGQNIPLIITGSDGVGSGPVWVDYDAAGVVGQLERIALAPWGELTASTSGHRVRGRISPAGGLSLAQIDTGGALGGQREAPVLRLALAVGGGSEANQDCVAIGPRAKAKATAGGSAKRATTIGSRSMAGYRSFAAGWSANADVDAAVAIGDSSIAAQFGVTVGQGSEAGVNGVNIGHDGLAGSQSINIGANGSADGGAVRIGSGGSAADNGAVQIGRDVVNSAPPSPHIIIGDGAETTSGVQSVNIGPSSSMSGSGGVGIGFDVSVSAGEGSVGIGRRSEVSAIGGVAIGQDADVSHSWAIALGNGVETTGVYQLNIGTRYLEMQPRPDSAVDSAPANSARLVVDEDGGKMRLGVRFPSGALQILATEP